MFITRQKLDPAVYTHPLLFVIGIPSKIFRKNWEKLAAIHWKVRKYGVNGWNTQQNLRFHGDLVSARGGRRPLGSG